MLSGLVRLILFRVLGARIMLGLAAFGWLRRMLAGRRKPPRTVAGSRQRPGARSGAGSDYQPSQGSSQIVHRDPR
jgi:hypothetical protein